MYATRRTWNMEAWRMCMLLCGVFLKTDELPPGRADVVEKFLCKTGCTFVVVTFDALDSDVQVAL